MQEVRQRKQCQLLESMCNVECRGGTQSKNLATQDKICSHYFQNVYIPTEDLQYFFVGLSIKKITDNTASWDFLSLVLEVLDHKMWESLD